LISDGADANSWPHLLQVVIQFKQELRDYHGLSLLVPSSRLASFAAPEEIGLAIRPIESAPIVSQSCFLAIAGRVFNWPTKQIEGCRMRLNEQL